MYWKVTCEEADDTAIGPAEPDGRFVLHRHCDADGPHLDLRLEQDDYLLGWRIDGVDLAAAPWAVEKAPHPLAWGRALFGPEATMGGKDTTSAPASRIPFSMVQAASFSVMPGSMVGRKVSKTDSTRDNARWICSISSSDLTTRKVSIHSSTSTISIVNFSTSSSLIYFWCSR